MKTPKTTSSELFGALYGRASTQELAERETLRQQKNLGIESAERLTKQTGRKHVIRHFLIEETGVSGSSTKKRIKFQELQRLVKEQKVSFVIAKEISRLSRSLRDFLQFCELCREHKVALHIGNLPGCDPNTATGQMMLAVIGAIAQFERELAIERVKTTVRSAAFNNFKINGSRPVLGFRRNPQERGRWVTIPGELQKIELLMRDFLSHGSMAKTVEKAKEEGITKLSGKPFNCTSLRSYFKNRKYIGEMLVKEIGNDEIKKPVRLPFGEAIDRSLFEKVQNQLDQNDELKRKNQHRLGKRIYILHGVLVTESGARYAGTSSPGRNKVKYAYYVERKTNTKVEAALLEEKVLASLANSLASEEAMESHTQEIIKNHKAQIEELLRESESLKTEMLSLQDREMKIILGLTNSNQNMGPDLIELLNKQAKEVAAEKDRVLTRQSDVNSMLEEFESFDLDLKKHRARAHEIIKQIRKAEPLRQRHFIRQVVEKIELKKTGEVRVYWRFARVFTAMEEQVASSKKWLTTQTTSLAWCPDSI
ncbi:MAG: recombinase family protein [Bdellovibrionaceae bacterium]|nr:recombinase family protein [Pseudobdellovibrionaceae bacterium]